MYKKRFSSVNSTGSFSPISGGRGYGATEAFGFANWQSQLPEVYTGHPNRVERYNQYELMDYDPEINSCLDIIAELSTQRNDRNNTPFDITFNEDPTPHEVELIGKQLKQWCKLNEFDLRTFKLFRNCLKYGDQVFLRDPETFKLNWVDMTKVVKVIVSESEGKLPVQYVIRDINPNLQNLTVASKTTKDFGTASIANAGATTPNNFTSPGGNIGPGGSRFQHSISEGAIDAEHIVHLSLTEGLDRFWPFGQSILENVFKVFKQKQLIEDAILIYRIQRAPERRKFTVHTGTLPNHLAMAHLERMKNEAHQRRIPSLSGGQATMDATYNPLSINEDYWFARDQEGKGMDVEIMPGGQNLGEITDLKYFTNQLARGLRVPSSYLPSGTEESSTAMHDGRVGTALIQESQFNNYCQRQQRFICKKLNEEFKLFLNWRGFNIDSSLFDINFTVPQNFAAYRQSELDSARVSTFMSMEALPYMSKRFALEKYMCMSQEDIKRNESMWHEERNTPAKETPKGTDMRGIGISSGDIGSDADLADDLLQPEEPFGGPMAQDMGMEPPLAPPQGSAQPTPEL